MGFQEAAHAARQISTFSLSFQSGDPESAANGPSLGRRTAGTFLYDRSIPLPSSVHLKKRRTHR